MKKILKAKRNKRQTIKVKAKVNQKVKVKLKLKVKANQKARKNLQIVKKRRKEKTENEDFFKKYEGEKKVWLDRLKEGKTKNETYSKGFKYLYEAKIIKLILEGVFLEKIQDMVEKEMCEKGALWGWDVMNEKKIG